MMMRAQQHRGPDSCGEHHDPEGSAVLGHNRLSIIDGSPAGAQPMSNHDGTVWVCFNGEIYNYLELRTQLPTYPYRSRTDTEVILAAYERWGDSCVEHFIGMFSFLIWDGRQRRLFAARDRFGVKPLYYHLGRRGELWIASEIAALWAGGVKSNPDPGTWATYLTYGLHDHSEATFWEDIRSLPPGHKLEWRDGVLRLQRWYDLAERVGAEYDTRPFDIVREEYMSLLIDSVRLRFRSDVPVGVCVSGGLDSSTLLGLVHAAQFDDMQVTAYTYVTGDHRYDELPWVEQMVGRTKHPLVVCRLEPLQIPDLARSVQAHESEPFGGIPTLAYALLHEEARARGTITLLDGNGMDEQWAGYDYYHDPEVGKANGPVQGSRTRSVRPDCLEDDFRRLAQPADFREVFPDTLRNRQYWDLRFSKIPRALRFNDSRNNQKMDCTANCT
jgi:asparagine synthase (glutamine-hydrolysing)